MTSAATPPTIAVLNLDDDLDDDLANDLDAAAGATGAAGATAIGSAPATLGSVRCGTGVPLTATGSAQTGVVCSVLFMLSLPLSVGPLREGRSAATLAAVPASRVRRRWQQPVNAEGPPVAAGGPSELPDG
jgi:hypothetical protein